MTKAELTKALEALSNRVQVTFIAHEQASLGKTYWLELDWIGDNVIEFTLGDEIKD